MGTVFGNDPCDPHAPTDIFGRSNYHRRQHVKSQRLNRHGDGAANYEEEIDKAQMAFRDAVLNGNESLAKFYIDEYPDIDFIAIPFDEYGHNCLQYAVILLYDHLELCTAFIHSGFVSSDGERSDADSITFPVSLIQIIADFTEPRLDIESRRIRTISSLIYLGASVQSISFILFQCMSVLVLIDLILQPDEPNSKTGETALQLAEKRNRIKVMDILQRKDEHLLPFWIQE